MQAKHTKLSTVDDEVEEIKMKPNCNDKSKYGIWTLMIEKEKDIDTVQQKLKDYWAMIASIAGLVAGFSYVVTNTDNITYKSQGTLDIELRYNIYGFFITLTLVLSLSSTLIATILYGSINQIGDKDLLLWFCQEFEIYFAIPSYLLLSSIVTTLCGCSISIAGIYDSWVWIVGVIAGGILFITVFCVYIKILVTLNQKQRHYLLLENAT